MSLLCLQHKIFVDACMSTRSFSRNRCDRQSFDLFCWHTICFFFGTAHGIWNFVIRLRLLLAFCLIFQSWNQDLRPVQPWNFSMFRTTTLIRECKGAKHVESNETDSCGHYDNMRAVLTSYRYERKYHSHFLFPESRFDSVFKQWRKGA